MVRRRWLIGQVTFVLVLAALALPSGSSALRSGIPIFLTASGPSPAVQTIPAGLYPIWVNKDTVTHTVVFASGCTIQVSPGATGQCGNGLWNVVGDYAYAIDGTAQGSVDVTPEGRIVTLAARRHKIRRGSELLLHGKLAVAQLSPPSIQGPRQPVVVLACSDRCHVLHRAVVVAKPRRSRSLADVHSVWQLRVRPRASTTYIVEANSQPAGGQFWARARSKPFRVNVVKS
jgi:hypothetical protein